MFNTLEDRLNKEEQHIRREIACLNKDLEAIETKRRKIKEFQSICPTCRGIGLERFTDAAGGISERECLTCKGVGKVDEIRCLHCGHIITIYMVAARRNGNCPWCGARLPDV